MIKYLLSILLIISFSAAIGQDYNQEKEKPPPLTRILFVLDGSQSMYGRWQSDIKMNIAQNLLSNLLDSLKDVDNIQLALRVYGHQKTYPPQDCNDTRLVVPFANDNALRIKNQLRYIKPKGTTPIAFALEQSAGDFPACDNCRNIIILITDGLEECGGDPCAVSADLQKRGIALKPFVIGIGRDFREAFDCVGTYYDASSEAQFSKALDLVISQALNSTTAQVNLIDAYNKPSETNVNMTFYDHVSGQIKYNFIQTMNSKGLPDTLLIDPLVTYDVVVHTLPPARADSIKITPGQHTIIPVNTPQGRLRLKMEGTTLSSRNLQAIVRRQGRMETINVQQFGQTENYIIGDYSLEILCLPRIYVEDINIAQSSTTTVEIPVPGIAVIQKTALGYGSLYVERDNELIWVYNFRENPIQESLILQPGRYRVVFRAKYSSRAAFTIEKRFRITSGKTTNVKIFQ
ncbi:MAG: VWA domain-containing protein [Bacteroidetes bacterium]|nr:VWA domain-containing protein [Bacteroidota bacterium]MCK5766080.1 VWA domain-containing protein [Bacteroidales bacterium]